MDRGKTRGFRERERDLYWYLLQSTCESKLVIISYKHVSPCVKDLHGIVSKYL